MKLPDGLGIILKFSPELVGDLWSTRPTPDSLQQRFFKLFEKRFWIKFPYLILFHLLKVLIKVKLEFFDKLKTILTRPHSKYDL
jgi:hypothetical protein